MVKYHYAESQITIKRKGRELILGLKTRRTDLRITIRAMIFVIVLAMMLPGLQSRTYSEGLKEGSIQVEEVAVPEQTEIREEPIPLAVFDTVEVITLQIEIPSTEEEVVEPEPDPNWFVLEDVPLSEEDAIYLFEICGEDYEKYAMMLAIYQNETGFNHTLVGHNSNGTRDWGIGQANDCTIRYLRDKLGVQYMAQLQEDLRLGMDASVCLLDYHLEATGDLGLALLRYQLGEGGYANRISQGEYTTRTHTKVMGYYDTYLDQVAGNKPVNI